ncbi:MAG: hypothetical protein GXP38_11810 [Chloroflexi bacterium]|nr:hypothetical protein [Chloroflexota bacterium]
MKTSTRLLLVASLLLLVLALSACGSMPTTISAPSQDFLLSFPRVVIDIGEDGTPSLAGFTADQLYMLSLGQMDFRWLRMDPALIQWFKDKNLQHIELIQKEDGLYVFANGEPLPHLAWSEDSLNTLSDLVGDYYPQIEELLTKTLPFMQRVGLDVVVRFPKADDVAEIPLRDMEVPIAQAIEAETEPSSLQIRLIIRYDKQGVPSVPGAEALLKNYFGVQMDQLRLMPQAVQSLTAAGIQHITLRVHNNSLYIFVNGKALPNLAWDADGLKNGVGLVSQLYGLQQTPSLNAMLDTLIPLLEATEGDVILKFPLQPGVKPIPTPGA